jgi:hypothetical protein
MSVEFSKRESDYQITRVGSVPSFVPTIDPRLKDYVNHGGISDKNKNDGWDDEESVAFCSSVLAITAFLILQE